MRVTHETGVLDGSESFYATPSELARTLFFHMTRFGHYICNTDYNFSDHSAIAQLESHQNFFLLYVVRGRLNIENAGEHYHAVAGQVGLVNCRLPHAYNAAEPLEYFWLHFDGPMAQHFFYEIIHWHNGRRAFFPFSEELIETQFHQLLLKLQAHSELSEADVSQTISRILCSLLSELSQEVSTSRDESVLAALQYIDENYFKNVSVESVAAHVNLSYSFFSRRFKICTGHSIYEYVTIRRLSEAKRLLMTTRAPLKEIAFSVGYHSESSFIVSFLAKQGCTPTEYRNLDTPRPF